MTRAPATPEGEAMGFNHLCDAIVQGVIEVAGLPAPYACGRAPSTNSPTCFFLRKRLFMVVFPLSYAAAGPSMRRQVSRVAG